MTSASPYLERAKKILQELRDEKICSAGDKDLVSH